MSLPGRPPAAWFHAHPDTSRGSLEPPPVKVVPVDAPCEANSTVFVFALLPVEQSAPRTEWQTLSQSSGTPVPPWSVTALPSSSNTAATRRRCVVMQCTSSWTLPARRRIDFRRDARPPRHAGLRYRPGALDQVFPGITSCPGSKGRFTSPRRRLRMHRLVRALMLGAAGARSNGTFTPVRKPQYESPSTKVPPPREGAGLGQPHRQLISRAAGGT